MIAIFAVFLMALGALIAWVFMLMGSEAAIIRQLKQKVEDYEDALMHVNHLASKNCAFCRVSFDYVTEALNKYRR